MLQSALVALARIGVGTSLDSLAAILRGTEAGAKLVGRGQVPERAKAFAAFGLGVLASGTPEVARRQEISALLMDVLTTPQVSAEVPVAAMLALGQSELPAAVTLPPQHLRAHPSVGA